MRSPPRRWRQQNPATVRFCRTEASGQPAQREEPRDQSFKNRSSLRQTVGCRKPVKAGRFTSGSWEAPAVRGRFHARDHDRKRVKIADPLENAVSTSLSAAHLPSFSESSPADPPVFLVGITRDAKTRTSPFTLTSFFRDVREHRIPGAERGAIRLELTRTYSESDRQILAVVNWMYGQHNATWSIMDVSARLRWASEAQFLPFRSFSRICQDPGRPPQGTPEQRRPSGDLRRLPQRGLLSSFAAAIGLNQGEIVRKSRVQEADTQQRPVRRSGAQAG